MDQWLVQQLAPDSGGDDLPLGSGIVEKVELRLIGKYDLELDHSKASLQISFVPEYLASETEVERRTTAAEATRHIQPLDM
jgi:hypothetical protein